MKEISQGHTASGRQSGFRPRGQTPGPVLTTTHQMACHLVCTAVGGLVPVCEGGEGLAWPKDSSGSRGGGGDPSRPGLPPACGAPSAAQGPRCSQATSDPEEVNSCSLWLARVRGNQCPVLVAVPTCSPQSIPNLSLSLDGLWMMEESFLRLEMKGIPMVRPPPFLRPW